MSSASVTAKAAIAFTPARRVNQSMTATLEKRALEWMARRAPRWLSSDQLTALGLIAQIGAGASYALSRYNRYALLLVIVCIALNWFGDSMDGTLARVRLQSRPRFGFYVDHVVDVFGAIALMCGLGLSGFVHWHISIAMLIGFLLLSAESYLATYTLAEFRMSQGIFGPTEIRLLLIAGTVALLHSPYATVFRHRMLLFDLGGVIAAVCMFATAMLLLFATQRSCIARSRCHEHFAALGEIQLRRRDGDGVAARRVGTVQPLERRPLSACLSCGNRNHSVA